MDLTQIDGYHCRMEKNMKLSELNIIDFRKNGNVVTFRTNRSARIVVTFISHKTARLYVDFSGNSEPNSYYAIERLPAVLPDVDITKTNDSFIVSSKELSLRLGKHNTRIDYLLNGTVLSSENEICRNDDGSLYCAHNMASSEHFYGLGEDNDAYLGSMDRRGTTRDMITGQRINIGHVTADIPVTFFMSTGENAPYGIFVDNSYRMIFDMGKSKDNEYFWRAEGGSFIQYFFCGDSFADILSKYTDLTGKPSLLPLWTLGYIQCKCSYWFWDEIDEIIETLDEKHFPLDCVVFDYDWAENFRNFKWKNAGTVTVQEK